MRQLLVKALALKACLDRVGKGSWHSPVALFEQESLEDFSIWSGWSCLPHPHVVWERQIAGGVIKQTLFHQVRHCLGLRRLRQFEPTCRDMAQSVCVYDLALFCNEVIVRGCIRARVERVGSRQFGAYSASSSPALLCVECLLIMYSCVHVRKTRHENQSMCTSSIHACMCCKCGCAHCVFVCAQCVVHAWETVYGLRAFMNACYAELYVAVFMDGRMHETQDVRGVLKQDMLVMHSCVHV